MPNANYLAGAAAERNIVRELRLQGYEAQRSAASHGVFDVYGVRADSVIFVQSKRGAKPSPSEYQSAIDQPVPPGAIKLVLWFPAGLRAARILYANVDPLPAWCAQVRWLPGLPPVQKKLRL